ncbi:MAG: 50S ribosomal protein L16 [Patescibacteria group bacterium]
MLYPKRVKHRKIQRGHSRGVERRASKLAFGIVGLKSLGTHWLKSNQIEAARKVILRHLKGKGKIWIRTFPDKPITFKGNEVGMGGGKGGVIGYVYPLKPGRIIFEIDGVPREIAIAALSEVKGKLPVRTKTVED